MKVDSKEEIGNTAVKKQRGTDILYRIHLNIKGRVQREVPRPAKSVPEIRRLFVCRV
jgi:hypothetical protein